MLYEWYVILFVIQADGISFRKRNRIIFCSLQNSITKMIIESRFRFTFNFPHCEFVCVHFIHIDFSKGGKSILPNEQSRKAVVKKDTHDKLNPNRWAKRVLFNLFQLQSVRSAYRKKDCKSSLKIYWENQRWSNTRSLSRALKHTHTKYSNSDFILHFQINYYHLTPVLCQMRMSQRCAEEELQWQ